jgi:2-polyprenyl-3-methyl-5-hydroxy-6-metoxy-1,4-benzoquinol methylase
VTQYATEVDVANRNTSHTLVTELVGAGRHVLDVGCSTGYLASALKSAGNEVSGIEVDPVAAEQARPFLKQLVVGDLNTLSLAEAFAGVQFDRVVLADVLEHITNPGAVLRDIKGLLAPEGKLVVSMPNVSHGSLRLALLQGSWRYSTVGLLDETHIRFYTLETIVGMLADEGYAVDEAWATLADPLRTEVLIDETALPGDIVDWVRHQPQAMHYQYVLTAVPAEAPGRGMPEIQIPVPIDSVRLEDAHTGLARERAAAERRALMLCDRMLGLEAELANIQRQRSVAGHYEGELARVLSTPSYRIGRKVTFPLRVARAVLRRLKRLAQ